jgi:ATP-dependent Clp protease protease subunit
MEIIVQVLCLEVLDPKKDIELHINSPGGSVFAGFALHDVMQTVTSDIVTICVGQCSSMGAFLLASGTKGGKRYVLPNSRTLIHQPLGGVQGQASDIIIQDEEFKKTEHTLNGILAERTGRTKEEFERDTDKNNFMRAREALEYGLIDHVVSPKSQKKEIVRSRRGKIEKIDFSSHR